MPSKAKKHSKTPSKVSGSEQSASPQTPFTSPPLDSDVSSEHDSRSSLEEASNRFPSLIGKSAFIGRVTDFEQESRGCKIWLSESSMVASSIAPGSIVTVSLACMEMRFSNSCPLSSLSFECTRQFELDSMDDDDTADNAGNYFALATVFPSSKVLKDGVRLSSNLSYTMGCPTLGRVIFVYPIQTEPLNVLLKGNNKPHNKKVDNLSIHDCIELYLELAPVKDNKKVKNYAPSATNFSAKKAHDRSENGISSPTTPMCQTKLSSPSPSELGSPRSAESASNLSNPISSYARIYDINEVLKDENAKQLLQICATPWLYSRILIEGNLVAIPILAEFCIFRVLNAKRLKLDGTSQDLIAEKSCSLQPHISESLSGVLDAFFVNRETKVYIHLRNTTETSQKRGLLSFQDIESKNAETIAGNDMSKLGGLDKEYAVLKGIIVSSMKNNLSSLGLRPTKGVLLHGPPGTGKTSMAQLCALDVGINLFSVNGPEIMSQYYGESEKALHEIFDSASRAAPAMVFIDELDAIAPARKEGGEELSQRMVATLLNLMDGINRTDGLLVLAATNRPDSIEPALRRPGRLDREIEIGVPSPDQRLDILHTLLGRMQHSLSDIQVQHLSMSTHGFVGADLADLCNQAALVCLERYANSKLSLHSEPSSIVYKDCSHILNNGPNCPSAVDNLRDCSDSALPVSDLPGNLDIPSSSCISATVSATADCVENGVSACSKVACLGKELCTLKVTFEDFEKARIKKRPSAMREVILEVPKVKWEDVGGQSEVKTQLMEAVEWPQKHRDAFKRIGARPPTGILMFGPPGCSKTLMARAVASEAGLNFLAVKGPELFSKWVGESEKAVRSLFAKARANAPSIIFFDEIDGLAVIRGKESDGVSVSDRVMSQLLVELDGLHQRVNVTVIAATNRPDKIDPALLRPGRFDRLLYVGPPNKCEREEIFQIHLRKIPCSSDVSIKELASLTDGYTGADISFVCRQAAVAAFEDNIDALEVTMKHLRTAIKQVQPSKIQSFKDLSAKFQRIVQSSNGQDELIAGESGYAKHIPAWTLVKSTVQFLYRFFPPGSKSASSR